MALKAYCPALIRKQNYSVPDLHFNLFFVIDGDIFGSKLNPNGDMILIWEIAFDVANEHRWFTDTWISA